MAQTDCQNNEGDSQLKYLGFIVNEAVDRWTLLSDIYGYAKENSGPLKERVDAVEGSVKDVVGPLYRKIEDKPYILLQFLDRKVEDVVMKVDNYVPPTLKSKTCQMYGAAKQASEVARSAVADALLPPSTYCIEKYNSGVKYLADEEYLVATCLPLLRVQTYKGLAREENEGSQITDVRKGQEEKSIQD